MRTRNKAEIRREELEAEKAYRSIQLRQAEQDHAALHGHLIGKNHEVFSWPEARYGERPAAGGWSCLAVIEETVTTERQELARVERELAKLPDPDEADRIGRRKAATPAPAPHDPAVHAHI